MGAAIDLGVVRRARAGLASITRQHPDTRATSLDALPALLDQENEGSITMVRQIKKLCEGCGLEYYAARSDQRFHSAACKAQHHRDIQAVEVDDSPIDPIAQALIRAFRLRVAGSLDAQAALYELLLLALAEVAPMTPIATPEPTPAQAVDLDALGERLKRMLTPKPAPVVASPIAAPALDADEIRTRLNRVLEDNGLTQKDISKASDVDQGSLSRFIHGSRKIGLSSLARIAIWLDEYEGKVKPR